MASRYRPNHRILMQAVEILRKHSLTNPELFAELAMIADRVEKLASSADNSNPQAKRQITKYM